MEDEYASDRSLDIDIAETLGESARRPAGKRTSALQSLRTRVRGNWAADRDQVESGVVRTATMTTPTQAGAAKKFGRRAPPPPVPEAIDGSEYERYNALPARGLFGRGGGPAQSEADADADPADAEGGFFGGRRNGSRGRTSHTSRFSVQRLSARLPGQLHLPSSRHSLFRRSLMRDGEYVYAFDNPNVGDEEANETYERVRVDPNAVETGDGTIKGGIKGVEATRYDAKKQPRHVSERIFMALLAVSFLWITSYAVCREIVLYVLEVPPYEEVANRNELAFETANFASESYILCVTSKADECEQASDRDLELELNRLNVIKASNEAKISELGTITTTAELQLNSSLTSLDILISSSVINLGGFLTNTGEADCGFVEELVSGQNAALKALYEVEEFQGQAELAVRSREAQIADRELYDKEYLENKTKQLKEVQETVVNVARDPRAAYDSLLGEMDEMAACGSSNLCESGASVRRVYTDGKGEAEAIFTEQKDGAQAYKDAVEAELEKFGSLIDKCNEGPVQAVLNVLFFDVPEKSESTEPSTLDNLQSTTLTYLDESEVFDDEKIAAIFESAKAKLGLQKEEEGAKHDELIENANDDSFFGDYNPPEVPDATKDSVQAFDDSSNTFLGSMGINLQAITGVANDKKGDDDLLLVNATTNLTTGEVLAEYTDHSEWSFYIYSSEIIEGVTTGMDDLTRLLVTLDIVFRVLHTIFIIRQYWSMSSLSTPPGDARVKASVGDGWGPKATPMQKMAAIITNPLVISTLVAGFTGALVYLAWAAYSPLYFEYVDSCVKAENYTTIDEGNATGTILYRNAYSVLFQYAAADGDQLAIDRVDELNVGRNVLCSQNSFDDTILYNNQAKMYNDYADRLFQTQGVATSLKTCLNMEAIQQQVEGTEHDQLYNQIIGPEFSADSELYLPDINGIYNCSAVGSCAPIRSTLEDSECPGPSEGLIKFRTFEASCTTENYAHSMLFSSFFIFSAFVCINLGRLFIMRGIVRLAWRHIVTGPYSFIGSCTDRGVIVYPEVVSEDEITMREAIEKAVKLRLKQWERWGLLIFFAGFAVNAPWIYGMLFIAENLTYSA